MGDLDSYLSRYIVQTVLHSIVLLVTVEGSLQIWEVPQAKDRFRFRLLTLLCPLLMFPLFQLLNPDRGNLYFIEDQAIFASSHWLQARIWSVPLKAVFGLMLAATAVTTALQELKPLARGLAGGTSEPGIYQDPGTEVKTLVKDLSVQIGIEPAPDVQVLDEDMPLLLIRGTTRPSILISQGAFDRFNDTQLASALTHELAHIKRRSNLLTVLVFLTRLAMFYNPVSLFVFRRLIQDDEQVCDDMTTAVTGDPDTLASTLELFYTEVPSREQGGYSGLKGLVENSSHNLLLEERVLRLRDGNPNETHPPALGFWMTLLTATGICYLVV